MKKTVIILGAGASVPFGYPSGPKLLELIIDSLNPRYTYTFKNTIKDLDTNEPRIIVNKQGYSDHSLYLKFGFSQKEINDFGSALLNSNKDSIDSFLLERNEFNEIGKFAISNCILKCENPNEYQFVTRNWLKYLWNKIGATYSHLVNSNIKFISFNYDRLIEDFFYNSIKHSSKIQDNDINKLISNLIVHLHGVVGYFPWQNKELGFDYYCSGQDFNSHFVRVSNACKSIKIIHDKLDSEDLFDYAWDSIQSAANVYCLGFGFHLLNLRRLKISTIENNIMCSAFGLTDHECKQIERENSILKLDRNQFDNLDFLRNNLSFN